MSSLNPNQRTVFFISDRTGITAETLGHSLLTQFPTVEFNKITIPYIDNADKAQKAVEDINRDSQENQQRPLVFSTIVEQELRDIVIASDGLTLDFFSTFLGPLEKELKVQSAHTVGKTHSMDDYAHYKNRIDAMNYALNNDDGINTKHYGKADVVLIGVSRCGKTPTCLYLALQFGVYAANYPIIEEDLRNFTLPDELEPHLPKLFGLTISPSRLASIRQERRKESKYATLEQCQKEIKHVEKLMKQNKIPLTTTTNRSIEEIATKVLVKMGIERQSF